MKTSEIRSSFLEFFAERDHVVVPSSSLVPVNDPTLIFTNAGMVPFKDALIGIEDPGYTRATSAQRCVRAGGKHNDLENVGYTARHHTFFEMLGNFSFGDYFKEETIAWAWEFVTRVLQLPEDRLWVTVHPDDEESRALWVDGVGVDPKRVTSLEENFWSMGDTGPCGPCTEIFFDLGPEVAGGPPGTPDEDGDRYMEFWNLVFPQFDRSTDGTLTPLASPGVDTGLGLERTAAITQGVHSTYETDIFHGLMVAAGRIAGIREDQGLMRNPSVRVIADHIRSSAFLIADGVTPSNEDRGYVLRRIIRRGLRHGHKLDINERFFHKLVGPLVEEMGEAYPEFAGQRERIERILLGEEERFAETLSQGMELLNKSIADLDGNTIPGEVVFKLYDTFGFPADLTADVAREKGLTVDSTVFEHLMDQQRERARAASRFQSDLGQQIRLDSTVDFTGYDGLEQGATVLALYRRQNDVLDSVETLDVGDNGVVVVDRTPFYAESGGQVGDRGVMRGSEATFQVSDTIPGGDQYLHLGVVQSGSFAVGDRLSARVDPELRRRTALNHSATHLLHAALREVLGSHVGQRGSLVDAERLRFDFSHGEPVTPAEIAEIEALVNMEIQRNTEVTTEILNYDDAIARGAMALFGERYGDSVRVLEMGEGFSVELCGGTHVRRTGDIGVLRVVSESGIAAGVRRVEAVSGPGALEWIEQGEMQLRDLGQLIRSPRHQLGDKVRQLVDQQRQLQRQLERAQTELATLQGSDLADQARDVGGVAVLAARLEEGDPKAMLATLDRLKDKLGSAVILLGRVDGGRVNLIAGVTEDLTDRISAGDVINEIGARVGARGGGRPDMAQGGGGDKPEALDDALDSLADWVAERG
ncbi:MAG: alanine--tRNA ligase [Gammaproteobacteria bacterium]|nr:MAG: alanine--tRNA ligase [Gammaproteobacteria bacterium]